MRLPLAAMGLMAHLLVSPFVHAAGDGIVVTAGKQGGAYFYTAQRLATAMQVHAGMATAGKRVEVLTSRGSLENLQRLDDPEHSANVALTQADALQSYAAEHTGFLDKVIVLGEVGKECVFIVTSTERPITTAADLKKEAGREIAVDDEGSGAAVTYGHMSALEPPLSNTTPVFVDSMEALLQLKVSEDYTRIGAVMVVQRPRRISPFLRIVLEDQELYRFVPIRKGDLAAVTLPGGSEAYTFENVTIGPRKSSAPGVDTICTHAMMIAATDKLSKDQRSRLSQVMLTSGKQIVGEDE